MAKAHACAHDSDAAREGMLDGAEFQIHKGVSAGLSPLKLR